VYSFAIVLWEILALEIPYSFGNGTDENDFALHVFQEELRPRVKSRWPVALQELLQRTWCPEQSYRLEMSIVKTILRAELVRLASGDESGLADHKRRRSTFVFMRESMAFSQDFKDKSSDFLDRSLNRSQRSANSRNRPEKQSSPSRLDASITSRST
jgi:hypothetical protein